MKRLLSVAVLLLSLNALPASEPPTGFVALINNRDLAGWRGGTTFDHRKLLEMNAADRAAQIAKWTAAMHEVSEKTGKPHWHVEGNELVNDGFGSFASTIKDYGNFELLLDYKTVAGADSGIYPNLPHKNITPTDFATMSVDETLEILAFMEAADESKRRGCGTVKLSEVIAKHQPDRS